MGGRTSGTRPKGNGAGHGGPKAGKGWGGEKKGAGTTERFHAGDQYRGAYNAESIAAAIADMDEIKQLYTAVLRDAAEPTPNRLNAADKLADRLEGKAVQKNITATVDDLSKLTDAELDERIAALEAREASAEKRTAQAAGAERPDDLVH